MKHKKLIEIPPYYIDTLDSWIEHLDPLSLSFSISLGFFGKGHKVTQPCL
jgi:hypothetical protein